MPIAMAEEIMVDVASDIYPRVGVSFACGFLILTSS
jgi:hypothetical protein